MKYTLAIIALMGLASAYDEAEGPTKADNGENDPNVVLREADVANGKKESGWTNPLGWTDDGSGDDTVLAGTHDDLIQIGNRNAVSIGEKLREIRMKGKRSRDEYDGDEDTVSPYDDMEQKKKFDWGVPAGTPGSKSAFSLPQKGVRARDAYDGDHTTVSPYDDMHQYKTGDFGVPKDDFEGAQIDSMVFKHKKDEYDGDHDTVSQYDDMPHFKKFDWGVDAGQPGSKSAFSLNQHKK